MLSLMSCIVLSEVFAELVVEAHQGLPRSKILDFLQGCLCTSYCVLVHYLQCRLTFRFASILCLVLLTTCSQLLLMLSLLQHVVHRSTLILHCFDVCFKAQTLLFRSFLRLRKIKNALQSNACSLLEIALSRLAMLAPPSAIHSFSVWFTTQPCSSVTCYACTRVGSRKQSRLTRMPHGKHAHSHQSTTRNHCFLSRKHAQNLHETCPSACP